MSGRCFYFEAHYNGLCSFDVGQNLQGYQRKSQNGIAVCSKIVPLGYRLQVKYFYDDRICKFIMSVPEKHLSGRQIQIEYIKKYAPKLAVIPWQDKAPYNLYNYYKHKN